MEEFILGFQFKYIYLCALGKTSGSHRLTSPENGECTIVPGHWPPLPPTLPAYANRKGFPPRGRGYEAAAWEKEEVCPGGCLQAPQGLYGFVADVRLTSLAHELGSMPCSVSVFAICHSLAPSLSKFSSRISCLRASGWETRVRAYCAFFFQLRGTGWPIPAVRACPTWLWHMGLLPAASRGASYSTVRIFPHWHSFQRSREDMSATGKWVSCVSSFPSVLFPPSALAAPVPHHLPWTSFC